MNLICLKYCLPGLRNQYCSWYWTNDYQMGRHGRARGHRHGMHRHGHRRIGHGIHHHGRFGHRRGGNNMRRSRRRRQQIFLRSSLGRQKIGIDFTSLAILSSIRDFSTFAGGNNFVGRNLFLLQWRRVHSYVAPPPPGYAGSRPSGHDFWRSQLPPNGPNFCAFNTSQLGQPGNLEFMVNTLNACCMTTKLGGLNTVTNMLQTLHNQLTSVPLQVCCCGLITMKNYVQLNATLTQWLLNLNTGLTFNVVVPPNTPPGSQLSVQQPDGQTVQIQLPLNVVSGQTVQMLALPALPSATTSFTLPHNCVAHLLDFEENKFLIFETPPVICPGSGQAIQNNPLWSGTSPTLSLPELQFVSNNYARTRGLNGQGITSCNTPNFLQELLQAGQVLDSLPPASMWRTGLEGIVGNGYINNGGGQQIGIEIATNGATGISNVATLPPTTGSFQVIVPPNAGQGDSIVVQSPSGCIFSVELPPGAEPGSALMVAMPDAWNGEPATQLVSAIDMDGDGIADVVGLDTNGDGKHDTYRKCVLVDTNGDGLFDSMAFDSTGDGNNDKVVARNNVLHQSSTGENIAAPVVLSANSMSEMKTTDLVTASAPPLY